MGSQVIPTTERRWLTADLAGTGGTFTASPDAFRVDELALYEPGGEGHHLYLRVEKRGWTTRDLVKRACQVFSVPDRDVGYAGLKDKHACTTQTISVLGIAPERAQELETDGVRVVWARRHRNKLRTGHLAGNRFEMSIDGAGEESAVRAAAILERLEACGLPNYYGDQRFGRDGDNATQALLVLRRGPRAAKSKWRARLLVSALQSALFNTYLSRRLDDGTFATVHAGDVLIKEESGGRFTSTEPAVDQGRYDAQEVSISGPIFGLEMRRPPEDTLPAEWEARVLADAELAIEDFRRVKRLAQGTRRPLRVLPRNPSAAWDGDKLIIRFDLPAGSYATVLMDEVLKPPPERDAAPQ